MVISMQERKVKKQTKITSDEKKKGTTGGGDHTTQ